METTIMENQMEKKMENEMETGITMGYKYVSLCKKALMTSLFFFCGEIREIPGFS